MGVNDSGEMLEIAKAEVVRLEQENAQLRAAVERHFMQNMKARGERDRARAVAAHLLEEPSSWR
jgi:hypothetical protein